jgi:putative FmdB family regulatory protein
VPRYQYKCNVCGGEQEVERSIHAEADNPVCCQETMTRVYVSVPIRFNSSGFYSTDNPKR